MAATIQDLSEEFLEELKLSNIQYDLFDSDVSMDQMYAVNHRDTFGFRLINTRGGGTASKKFDRNAEPGILLDIEELDTRDTGFLSLDGDDEVVDELVTEIPPDKISSVKDLNENILAVLNSIEVSKPIQSSENREVNKIISMWRSSAMPGKSDKQPQVDVKSSYYRTSRQNLKESITRLGGNSHDLRDISQILKDPNDDEMHDEPVDDSESLSKIEAFGAQSPINLNMKLIAAARQWLIDWLPSVMANSKVGTIHKILYSQLFQIVIRDQLHIRSLIVKAGLKESKDATVESKDGDLCMMAMYIAWLIPKLDWVSKHIWLTYPTFSRSSSSNLLNLGDASILKTSIFDTTDTRFYRACIFLKESSLTVQTQYVQSQLRKSSSMSQLVTNAIRASSVIIDEVVYIGTQRVIQNVAGNITNSMFSQSMTDMQNWKNRWVVVILDEMFPECVNFNLIKHGSVGFKSFAFICASVLVLSPNSIARGNPIEYAIQLLAEGVSARKQTSSKLLKFIHFNFLTPMQARFEFEHWARDRAASIEETKVKGQSKISNVQDIESLIGMVNVDSNPIAKSSNVQALFKTLPFPNGGGRLFTPLEAFTRVKISKELPFIHLVEDISHLTMRSVFHPTTSFFTSFYQLAIAAEENGLVSPRLAYLTSNMLDEAVQRSENVRRYGPVKSYRWKSSSDISTFNMPKENAFYGVQSGSFVMVVDSMCSNKFEDIKLSCQASTTSSDSQIVVILKPNFDDAQSYTLQFHTTFDNDNSDTVQSDTLLTTISQIVERSFQGSIIMDAVENASKKSAKGHISVEASWLNAYMLHFASIVDPTVSKYIWIDDSTNSTMPDYTYRDTFYFNGGFFTYEPIRTSVISSKKDIDDWVVFSFTLNRMSDLPKFPKFLSGILGCVWRLYKDLYSHMPGAQTMSAVHLRNKNNISTLPTKTSKLAKTKFSKIKDIRSSVPKELLSANYVTECQCEKSPVLISPDESDAWEAMERKSFNFKKSFLTPSSSLIKAKEVLDSATDPIQAVFVCPRDKNRYPAVRVSNKSKKPGSEKFVCCFNNPQRATISTLKSMTLFGDDGDGDYGDGDDTLNDRQDPFVEIKHDDMTFQNEDDSVIIDSTMRLRGDYLVMRPTPVPNLRVGAIPVIIHSFLIGITKAYGHHFVRLGIPQGSNSLITALRTVLQSSNWPNHDYLKSGIEFRNKMDIPKWILNASTTDETIRLRLIDMVANHPEFSCAQEFPNSCFFCPKKSCLSYISQRSENSNKQNDDNTFSFIDSKIVIRALEELLNVNIVILVTDRSTDWCSISMEIPKHARVWLPPGILPDRRPTIILIRLQSPSGQSHYEPIVSRGEIIKVDKGFDKNAESIPARLLRVKKNTAFSIFHEYLAIAFWKIACRLQEPVKIYSSPFESRRQYPGISMTKPMSTIFMDLFSMSGKLLSQSIDYYGKLSEVQVSLSNDKFLIHAFVEPLPPFRKIPVVPSLNILKRIKQSTFPIQNQFAPFPLEVLALPIQYESIAQGIISVPFGQTLVIMTLSQNVEMFLLEQRSQSSQSSTNQFIDRQRASTLALQLIWWMRTLFRAIVATFNHMISPLTFDKWFDLFAIASDEPKAPINVPFQFPNFDTILSEVKKKSIFEHFQIILLIGKLAKYVWSNAFTLDGVFIGASAKSLEHIKSFMKRVEEETENIEFAMENPFGGVPTYLYGLHSSKSVLFGNDNMSSSSEMECDINAGLAFESIRDFIDWKLYNQSNLEQMNDVISIHSEFCTANELFLRRGTKNSSSIYVEIDESTIGSITQKEVGDDDTRPNELLDNYYVIPSRRIYKMTTNPTTSPNYQHSQNFLFSPTQLCNIQGKIQLYHDSDHPSVHITPGWFRKNKF